MDLSPVHAKVLSALEEVGEITPGADGWREFCERIDLAPRQTVNALLGLVRLGRAGKTLVEVAPPHGYARWVTKFYIAAPVEPIIDALEETAQMLERQAHLRPSRAVEVA